MSNPGRTESEQGDPQGSPCSVCGCGRSGTAGTGLLDPSKQDRVRVVRASAGNPDLERMEYSTGRHRVADGCSSLSTRTIQRSFRPTHLTEISIMRLSTLRSRPLTYRFKLLTLIRVMILRPVQWAAMQLGLRRRGDSQDRSADSTSGPLWI
jgi:hypothetical protein